MNNPKIYIFQPLRKPEIWTKVCLLFLKNNRMNFWPVKLNGGKKKRLWRKNWEERRGSMNSVFFLCLLAYWKDQSIPLPPRCHFHQHHFLLHLRCHHIRCLVSHFPLPLRCHQHLHHMPVILHVRLKLTVWASWGCLMTNFTRLSCFFQRQNMLYEEFINPFFRLDIYFKAFCIMPIKT